MMYRASAVDAPGYVPRRWWWTKRIATGLLAALALFVGTITLSYWLLGAKLEETRDWVRARNARKLDISPVSIDQIPNEAGVADDPLRFSSDFGDHVKLAASYTYGRNAPQYEAPSDVDAFLERARQHPEAGFEVGQFSDSVLELLSNRVRGDIMEADKREQVLKSIGHMGELQSVFQQWFSADDQRTASPYRHSELYDLLRHFRPIAFRIPWCKPLLTEEDEAEVRRLVLTLMEWLREGEEEVAALRNDVADQSCRPADAMWISWSAWRVTGLPWQTALEVNKHTEWIFQPAWRAQAILALRQADLEIDAASKNSPCLQQDVFLPGILASLPNESLQRWSPSIHRRLAKSMNVNRACRRLVATHLAIGLFSLENGRKPASLDELVPDLLDADEVGLYRYSSAPPPRSHDSIGFDEEMSGCCGKTPDCPTWDCMWTLEFAEAAEEE